MRVLPRAKKNHTKQTSDLYFFLGDKSVIFLQTLPKYLLETAGQPDYLVFLHLLAKDFFPIKLGPEKNSPP